MCDELRRQYAEETFNYAMLPGLLRKLAGFYESILTEPRFEPEYFRVGFYGKGFPTFIQNKVIIILGDTKFIFAPWHFLK